MKRTRAKVVLAAALRRLRRATGGSGDPYPPAPPDVRLDPSAGVQAALDAAAEGARRWAAPTAPDAQAAAVWAEGARDALAELTGYARARAAGRRPTVSAERPETSVGDGVILRSLYLRIRPETDLPVHLIYDPERLPEGPAPVFLHLAGSTSGVHLAWGGVRVPIDHERVAIGADMARQAARRGYLGVAIEQLGYGERGERSLSRRSANRTIDAHNHLTLIGRTLMGDGAADVSAALDFLLAGGAGRAVDPARLFLFGHSAGGTLAQFAAALDPRISGVLASGSVGFLRETIAARGAPGGDAVAPGLLSAFETPDLIGLIAPRPFVGLGGRSDQIFPFDGTARAVEAARPVFDALGAEARLAAVATEGAHRYYAAESWEAFTRWIDPPVD